MFAIRYHQILQLVIFNEMLNKAVKVAITGDDKGPVIMGSVQYACKKLQARLEGLGHMLLVSLASAP